MSSFKKQYAVRFIHSEVEHKTPDDLSLIPVGIGINAGDGSVFISDEDGKTIRLTDAQNLELEKYVGRGRPLSDFTSEDDEVNLGTAEDLTGTLNHLYHHTLLYTPPGDERRLGFLTVPAGSVVSITPPEVPTLGDNKVTVRYQNPQSLQYDEIDYVYSLVGDIEGIRKIRLRHRCIEGQGRFSAVDNERLEDPDYTPSEYDFIPQGGGMWLVELVHDFSEGPSSFEGGDLVGYLAIGVNPYV